MGFQPSEQMRRAGWSFPLCHSRVTLLWSQPGHSKASRAGQVQVVLGPNSGENPVECYSSNSSILGRSL